MWVPKSEADIIQAVDSNSLEESAIFDGKGSIPTKSSEIAKDIAEMCNDGV